METEEVIDTEGERKREGEGGSRDLGERDL